MKMKLVPSLRLLVAMATPVMAAPVMSVVPPSSQHSVGDVFSLDINISGAVRLISYQFDLGFNPSVIYATGVSFGPLLQTGGGTVTANGEINNTTGLIDSIAEVLISGAVSGDGVLASIAFSVVGAGSSDVNLANVILLDEDFVGLSPALENATVTVPTTLIPEPVMFGPLVLSVLVFSRFRRQETPITNPVRTFPVR